MKIYVAIVGVDYEASHVIGVFVSKEEAITKARKSRSNWSYDYWEVYLYDTDNPTRQIEEWRSE